MPPQAWLSVSTGRPAARPSASRSPGRLFVTVPEKQDPRAGTRPPPGRRGPLRERISGGLPPRGGGARAGDGQMYVHPAGALGAGRGGTARHSAARRGRHRQERGADPARPAGTGVRAPHGQPDAMDVRRSGARTRGPGGTVPGTRAWRLRRGSPRAPPPHRGGVARPIPPPHARPPGARDPTGCASPSASARTAAAEGAYVLAPWTTTAAAPGMRRGGRRSAAAPAEAREGRVSTGSPHGRMGRGDAPWTPGRNRVPESPAAPRSGPSWTCSDSTAGRPVLGARGRRWRVRHTASVDLLDVDKRFAP